MPDSHCSRAADATITCVEHLDVVIVGAGLSGIGAAHHLQDRLPGLSYAVLEAREAIPEEEGLGHLARRELGKELFTELSVWCGLRRHRHARGL